LPSMNPFALDTPENPQILAQNPRETIIYH
jgi:hypothetical protein